MIASREITQKSSQENKCVPSPSANVLHDVKSGIVVSTVDDAIAVHEYVSGLSDARAIGPMIDESCRLRRHQGADFEGMELIADVEYTNASVLIRRENKLRTHIAAGPILVN